MTNSPATRAAFEVNAYDKEGDAQLHLGQFDSIEAAQEAIACHSGGTLDPRARLGAQSPSIIESWPVAGVEYVVHVSPARPDSIESAARLIEDRDPALAHVFHTQPFARETAAHAFHGSLARSVGQELAGRVLDALLRAVASQRALIAAV